jgi:hypothetical protein
MTETIVEVGKPLGIVVHDHLIIGRDGHTQLPRPGPDLTVLVCPSVIDLLYAARSLAQ